MVQSMNDITGQKINRLTAIRFSRSKTFHGGGKKHFWWFLCECGLGVEMAKHSFLSGASKSCGCLSVEAVKKRCTTHGDTVGYTRSRLFRIFTGIKTRCENQNETAYKWYGGRGIKCLWECYEDFKSDMELTYQDGLTIDRIDVNGNYCKENCRWATRKEQARNTTRNHFLEFEGKSKPMSEWAEIFGMSTVTLFQRLKRGWSIHKSLTTPVRYLTPIA